MSKVQIYPGFSQQLLDLFKVWVSLLEVANHVNHCHSGHIIIIIYIIIIQIIICHVTPMPPCHTVSCCRCLCFAYYFITLFYS